MTPGQVVQGGHSTIIASRTEIIPGCAIDHNHASLIDAGRLTRSARGAAVRRALAGRDEPAAFVVSDAVFSVDGGQAPVAELHAVARDHGALLVIDEAHSFGVIGPGGAVLAAPEVIGTLVDTGRGFIFDTGLAPPCAGAALAALEVIEAEPELGARARPAASGRPRSQ